MKKRICCVSDVALRQPRGLRLYISHEFNRTTSRKSAEVEVRWSRPLSAVVTPLNSNYTIYWKVFNDTSPQTTDNFNSPQSAQVSGAQFSFQIGQLGLHQTVALQLTGHVNKTEVYRSEVRSVSCSTERPPPKLLLYSQTQLQMFDQNLQTFQLLFDTKSEQSSTSSNISSVAYIANERLFFWIDLSFPATLAHYNGFEKKMHKFLYVADDANCLQVDWVQHVLYWVENGNEVWDFDLVHAIDRDIKNLSSAVRRIFR